jgi:putative ABC transport system permease protein
VQAVVGDYATLQKYTVKEGEVYDWNDREYNEPVVVVSDGFADAVKKNANTDILGREISIKGQPFKVVGIISSNSMTYTRGDGVIFVPYRQVVGSLISSQNFSTLAVILKDSSYYEIAGKQVLSGLNASRQLVSDSNDVFAIETSKSFIETAQQTTNMISVFLGIVGGIALFVGGIGTMNMMLTTVTERTREIGLRKAIGARDGDILLQILIESVMLTSLGGAIGIALSLVVGKIANTLLAGNQVISVLINTQVIILAAIVAVVVGVVFGLYPARNAARLQPVDALRSE